MRKKDFDDLVKSVRQAGKISLGEIKPSRQFSYRDVDVKAIRNNTGLTQDQFATMIGVHLRTLQNWEQGHRRPAGPALALLTVFKNDPQNAFLALHHWDGNFQDGCCPTSTTQSLA